MNPKSYETLKLDVDERGVARLTLARPQAHNALNAQLITDLQDAVDRLAAGADAGSPARAVVLTGEGESFCAGGDLRWMQANMKNSRSERLAESASLATMLRAMNELPMPVIGRINGPAYGGGVGMISVCDIAIGVESAKFALTEVSLGLLPANIAPYVVARIGAANARRTMLTARRMTAHDAKAFGLLSEVVGDDDLDAAIERELSDLLRCAPGAVAATKKLIAFVDHHDLTTSMVYTADRLADAWDSAEGQEGVACFFEKRTPPWRKP